MRINWKCVWKVLKPYIIGLVLIIALGIIAFFGFGLLIVMVGNVSQSSNAMMVGTASYTNSIYSILLIIISGLGFIYFSIQFLKDVLKPCITWEGE